MGQIKQVFFDDYIGLLVSISRTILMILQVGKLIYDRDVDIEMVKEEMLFDMHVVTFNLRFDTRAFAALTAMDREDQRLPLKASIFIEIFPFCILFGYA